MIDRAGDKLTTLMGKGNQRETAETLDRRHDRLPESEAHRPYGVARPAHPPVRLGDRTTCPDASVAAARPAGGPHVACPPGGPPPVRAGPKGAPPIRLLFPPPGWRSRELSVSFSPSNLEALADALIGLSKTLLQTTRPLDICYLSRGWRAKASALIAQVDVDRSRMAADKYAVRASINKYVRNQGSRRSFHHSDRTRWLRREGSLIQSCERL
jgi:hypothetical protein